MTDMNLQIKVPNTTQGYKALGDFIALIGSMQDTTEVINPPADEPILVGAGNVFSPPDTGAGAPTVVDPPDTGVGAPPDTGVGAPPDTGVGAPPAVDPPGTGLPAVGGLDCHGRPWDARINAKAKTKNKTGDWKLIRGIDKTLVTTIYAELDGAAPPLDTPPVDTPKVTGADCTNLIVTATQDGTLDFEAATAMLQTHGIGNMMLIGNFPDKIAIVHEALCNMRR